MARLSDIANDILTHVSGADQWLAKIVQEHVPELLAAAEKYENSPIVQALEAAALPPEVEQQLAAVIATLARQYPAPQQPAVAQPGAGEQQPQE